MGWDPMYLLSSCVLRSLALSSLALPPGTQAHGICAGYRQTDRDIHTHTHPSTHTHTYPDPYKSFGPHLLDRSHGILRSRIQTHPAYQLQPPPAISETVFHHRFELSSTTYLASPFAAPNTEHRPTSQPVLKTVLGQPYSRPSAGAPPQHPHRTHTLQLTYTYSLTHSLTLSHAQRPHTAVSDDRPNRGIL
jgi:hypothetical protein